MSQPIRSTIGQIFVQFIIALIAFSALASLASANTMTGLNEDIVSASTMEAHQHITQFKVLDSDAQNSRLEGRLRANIAFNKLLSKEMIEVNVNQHVAVITGKVSSSAIISLVKQEALALFAENEIDLQLVLKPEEQVIANESGLAAKLARLFKD